MDARLWKGFLNLRRSLRQASPAPAIERLSQSLRPPLDRLREIDIRSLVQLSEDRANGVCEDFGEVTEDIGSVLPRVMSFNPGPAS